MFMPSPGTLERFAPPPESDHLRIDSGYRQGDSVTPFYDPMLAKVIAWDDNRAQACERAVTALRAFEVEGLRCNRDFLIACLMDEAFARGDLHAGFIEANKAALTAA
jgi:acetyl/propionyl-CoA carboxylase alpha subunit